MKQLVVSGLTIVLVLAAGAMAFAWAAEIFPVSMENQIQMHQIPNSYDGRLGYVSILNAAMPARQGAELDIVLPAIPVENESMVEEVTAITQTKINSQTGLVWSHGKNCRVE